MEGGSREKSMVIDEMTYYILKACITGKYLLEILSEFFFTLTKIFRNLKYKGILASSPVTYNA